MKYLFWVTSSRMTDIKEVVEIDDSWEGDESTIKNFLEQWCEEMFPMFHFTDAIVKYGYQKEEGKENDGQSKVQEL